MFGHQSPQATGHTGRGVIEARVGGGKRKALHGKGLEPALGRPLPRQRFVARLCVVFGLRRRRCNRSGMGMRTGHTSPQAPHRLEAVTRSLVLSSPSRWGR